MPCSAAVICVSEQAIRAKARKMPLAYLADCQATADTTTAPGQWCFSEADYHAIRERYRGYSLSIADLYQERISGCCDRADQY